MMVMVTVLTRQTVHRTYATLSNPRKNPGVRVPILLPVKERNLGRVTGGK
jgi:hypothetical protein